MKRIVLLGLIGFILSGCGDDKVTNEYLVGEWDCGFEEYESKYDSKLKEYNDFTLKNSDQFKQFYKIVDGVLMLKYLTDEPVEVNLDEIYKNPITEDKINDCDYTINRNLIKNSSNKYSWQLDVFIACSDKAGEATKLKNKIIRVCTRTE